MLQNTKPSKIVKFSLVNWRDAILKQEEALVTTESELLKDEVVIASVNDGFLKRLIRVIYAQKIGETQMWNLRFKLEKGETFQKSAYDWNMQGQAGATDLKDILNALSYDCFYIGMLDQSVNVNKGLDQKKPPREYFLKVYSTDKWKSMEFGESNFVDSESFILVCLDSQNWNALTKRTVFPSKYGGGLLNMNGLFKEYKRKTYGESGRTTEEGTITMLRAISWKYDISTNLGKPIVRTLGDIGEPDVRLIMKKLASIDTEMVWTYPETVGTTKNNILLAISSARKSELVKAIRRHWRCLDLNSIMTRRLLEVCPEHKFFCTVRYDQDSGNLMISDSTFIFNGTRAQTIFRDCQVFANNDLLINGEKAFSQFLKWCDALGEEELPSSVFVFC